MWNGILQTTSKLNQVTYYLSLEKAKISLSLKVHDSRQPKCAGENFRIESLI
jgi:hypothetical protein